MSVQEALSYRIPDNTCSRPEIIADEANVTPPMQESSSVPIFEGSITATVSNVDTNERRRQARKERRWRKCLAEYKESLLDDMERLKGSAQHGLTEEQAHTILSHMALIQRVYLSAEGALEEPGNPEEP